MAKDLLCVNENLIKNLEHQLEEVKHPSRDEHRAVNSKLSGASGFDATHEKKRSYGTITTFRSYTSDLKDSPSGDNSNVTKETKEILPVKPTKKVFKKNQEKFKRRPRQTPLKQST